MAKGRRSWLISCKWNQVAIQTTTRKSANYFICTLLSYKKKKGGNQFHARFWGSSEKETKQGVITEGVPLEKEREREKKKPEHLHCGLSIKAHSSVREAGTGGETETAGGDWSMLPLSRAFPLIIIDLPCLTALRQARTVWWATSKGTSLLKTCSAQQVDNIKIDIGNRRLCLKCSVGFILNLETEFCE